MNEFKQSFNCDCGKTHNALIDEYVVKKGAVNDLPKYIEKYSGKKVFLLADINTFGVAGEKVVQILTEKGIGFSKYVFGQKNLEPDEFAVGSAIMHYDNSCDMVVTIGSGVLNDIGKIVANTAKVPYIVVATAPSMDGYASASSSMSRDGLKISLPSKCANAVIGDIDILKTAPDRMLISGLGDMLAKYISICEWRIANVITGEYYCEKIAQLVRTALKKCTDNATGLLKRDDEAIKAVFEGLVIGGVAMNYAGLSRPASGVEHYFSHVWDMRALEFGTNMDLHGIQCAIGTLYAAKIYDAVRECVPDREKALAYTQKFDYEVYKSRLQEFLGKGSEEMIALEAKEKKYDIEKHKERLEKIIENWDKIINIINEEVPSSAEISKILDVISAPKTAGEIGIDEALVPITFETTKDIRDKYVLSRLCWDLGIVDEMSKIL